MEHPGSGIVKIEVLETLPDNGWRVEYCFQLLLGKEHMICLNSSLISQMSFSQVQEYNPGPDAGPKYPSEQWPGAR